MARLGAQMTTDPSYSPADADADQDPYDQMLLTKRNTAVVTQATQMLDSAPDFYGDQQTEQDLFNTIGADGGARRRMATASQEDGLAAAVPGVAPSGATALSTAAAPAKSHKLLWILLGLAGVGLATGGTFFILKHRRKR